jgi:hypothetical protein
LVDTGWWLGGCRVVAGWWMDAAGWWLGGWAVLDVTARYVRERQWWVAGGCPVAHFILRSVTRGRVTEGDVTGGSVLVVVVLSVVEYPFVPPSQSGTLHTSSPSPSSVTEILA